MHSNERLREFPSKFYRGSGARKQLRDLLLMDFSFNFLEVLPDSFVEAYDELEENPTAVSDMLLRVKRAQEDAPPKGTSLFYFCMNLKMIDLRHNELKMLPVRCNGCVV